MPAPNRVPRDVRVRLCTVNGGEVLADRTSGDFDVSNVNGRIVLKGMRGIGSGHHGQRRHRCHVRRRPAIRVAVQDGQWQHRGDAAPRPGRGTATQDVPGQRLHGLRDRRCAHGARTRRRPRPTSFRLPSARFHDVPCRRGRSRVDVPDAQRRRADSARGADDRPEPGREGPPSSVTPDKVAGTTVATGSGNESVASVAHRSWQGPTGVFSNISAALRRPRPDRGRLGDRTSLL